ncbi:thioredoxin fold domain-containing protein [Vibrio agarivorans]|uniref:thioredoxin fold domain-containing protein n=1 Tax=Vibrio agarivorans TaxID=153622 RepID=UPI0025B6206C|nr:thioredoxin fold domain-containing protein [Vibrio agarivorans]MDN3662462.1 thioredoxin fold domain-containing protein [Vibrio agarivorans]
MRFLRPVSLLSASLFVVACNAEESVSAPAAPAAEKMMISDSFDKAALIQKFTALRLQVSDIVPADIPGLLEVQTSSGVLFSSLDGEHFIAGTLYGFDGDGNVEDILAKRQQPKNAELIAQYTDSMIEFKADDEKHVLTIFTDITCGYCVKLHNDMGEYNKRGITVRYLAYPRQGPQGPVAEQMAQIWCADDQQAAMHNGKVNRQFPERNDQFEQCLDTVQQSFALGRKLGISGTPALFTESGELISGYMPPEALIKQLDKQ